MIYISNQMTLKQIRGLEKSFFKKRKDEPIIFSQETFNPKSSASLIFLNQYYKTIEKNPNGGIQENDKIFLIKQATVNGTVECAYCKKQIDPETITFDHIVPLYFGGKYYFSNLRLSCISCNSMKGPIHPEKMVKCWEKFNENVSKNVYCSALELMFNLPKEGLSEEELKSIQIMIKKEISWRIASGKNLHVLERLGLLPVPISA